MEQSTQEKAGRPSHFTQELADEICARLSEGGKSLRTVCEELNIHHTTVLTWARDNPQFADQYARARVIADDVDFDDIVDEASEPPPTVKGFVDAGWVAWKRNLIDAKKWSLSKRRPKKYGDRTVLAGDPEEPIRVVDSDVDLSRLSMEQLTQLELLLKAAGIDQSQTKNTELLVSGRAGEGGD